ncbi:MAG: DNA-directed RNA polymerase subunit omega [Bacteroidota bacterium]
MKSTALRSLKKMLDSFDNIYEVTIIIAKRAKQILDSRKESFEAELDSIGVTGHPEEMSINKDSWQEAVYKKYQKKPKPMITAIEDLVQDKISYRYLSYE